MRGHRFLSAMLFGVAALGASAAAFAKDVAITVEIAEYVEDRHGAVLMRPQERFHLDTGTFKRLSAEQKSCVIRQLEVLKREKLLLESQFVFQFSAAGAMRATGPGIVTVPMGSSGECAIPEGSIARAAVAKAKALAGEKLTEEQAEAKIAELLGGGRKQSATLINESRKAKKMERRDGEEVPTQAWSMGRAS